MDNILTNYLANNCYHKFHETDRSGAIHPSDLGECLRVSFYRYKGFPSRPHDVYLKKVFFHAFEIQNWMNDALEASGLLLAHHIPISCEFEGVKVVGEIDHIIKVADFSEPGWCIVDTKTVGDAALKYKQLPEGDHCVQVTAYSILLRHMVSTLSFDELAEALFERQPQDSKSIVAADTLASLLTRLMRGKYGKECAPRLTYISRGDLTEQWFVVSPARRSAVETRLRELAGHIAGDELPPRPYRSDDERCTKASRSGVRWPACDFYEQCWLKDGS